MFAGCQVEPPVMGAQREADDRASVGSSWYSEASNTDSVLQHTFCPNPPTDPATANSIGGYRKQMNTTSHQMSHTPQMRPGLRVTSPLTAYLHNAHHSTA